MTSEFQATDADLEQLDEIPYPDLARREQAAPLPLPTLNPPLLPLHDLDPEVFERVVAEIVQLRRDNRGAHFYGRRGQKQYGLDIVELENDGGTSLYQVKRYQEVTPEQLRTAVEEYAGQPRKPGHGLPPRRFNPRRFVVVTSARTDNDTNKVDEVAALRRDYREDLEIEVWGAETLSRTLRDTPGLVAAVFGRPWAEAFCGIAPPAPSPQEPRPLGLVEEPVQVIGVATLLADAQAREQADPTAAAALYAAVAEALDAAAFPGHAALMRSRQAGAARAAGDVAAAFDLRFSIELTRLVRGDEVRLRHESELAADAQTLGGTRLAKWQIIVAAANWHEEGSDLATVADAVEVVAASGDPDAPLLSCLVLEQSLVDGLFDFEPPHSLVANVDADTPTRLAKIRDAAAAVSSNDPVTRARLRCALADTALHIDSTPDDVEAAYAGLIDDATAGRLLHAGGIVASRAAYAFALHGDVDRAESLWRRSVLDSGQHGLYGDARNALEAIHAARADVGQWLLRGLSTVVEAMPNRRRLLEARHDVSLTALEAVQDNRLPDAFGSARRWLWEARLSGHLVEELLAWRQFGRVLAAGGHPDAAVECLVAAAEADEAAQAAKSLQVRLDTWKWTASPFRGRRAAAIRVAAEQVGLYSDDELTPLADQLLAFAAGLWDAPAMNPNPQLDAVKALARLGVRIPETAVDGILALSAPAIERSTRGSDEIANLLIQAYWAVATRRDDLGAAIGAMLRQPTPPHNLWGLVQNIPPAARDPLLETLKDLAGTGNAGAVAALAAWRHAPSDVQLVARRAAAGLLRRPVGHDRNTFSLGTQEIRVADLVLALLDADEEAEIPAEQLVPALCSPVGGVIMSRGVVVEESETPETSGLGASEGAPADGQTVDDAARAAAAPRLELLVAVAGKLLALGEDRKDMAGSRQQALIALLRLTPRLPADAAAAVANRLADLHDDPGLSETDLWEMQMNTPLSRTRIDTGAASLARTALVGAAEALETAGKTGADIAKDADFAQRLVAAALPLLHGDAVAALTGAQVVALVAASAASLGHYATALLLHPDPDVRAVGARFAPVDGRLFTKIAADPVPRVRAAAASRGQDLPGPIREALAADTDAGVRHALRHADDS